MDNISALYTIDQVVQEAMNSYPELQLEDKQYDRFLAFVVRGIRHLRLYVTKDGKKIVKVTPNLINRVPFPVDMEEFIGLGVPVNGKIYWLTRNNEIVTTTTVSGIDESLDSDKGEGVVLETIQANTWASVGGVNLQGYYTLDYEKEELVINANRSSDLLLAYVSSGISNTDVSYIPSKYVEALIDWIAWKDIQKDRSVPETTKLSYKKSFDDSCRNIIKSESNSLWEIMDAWRSKSILTGI